jgi:hypothetical protein
MAVDTNTFRWGRWGGEEGVRGAGCWGGGGGESLQRKQHRVLQPASSSKRAPPRASGPAARRTPEPAAAPRPTPPAAQGPGSGARRLPRRLPAAALGGRRHVAARADGRHRRGSAAAQRQGAAPLQPRDARAPGAAAAGVRRRRWAAALLILGGGAGGGQAACALGRAWLCWGGSAWPLGACRRAGVRGPGHMGARGAVQGAAGAGAGRPPPAARRSAWRACQPARLPCLRRLPAPCPQAIGRSSRAAHPPPPPLPLFPGARVPPLLPAQREERAQEGRASAAAGGAAI